MSVLPGSPSSPGRRLLFAGFVFGAALAVTAAPEDGETFDNWTVKCEPGKDGAPAQCFIFQNLILREGGQRVLHIAVGYSPDHPEPVVLLTLPLGISLPPGISLQVDQHTPFKFPVERCEPTGCRAGIKLDADRLDTFKTGTDAKVTFHDANRQPVTLPLSLKGFNAGLRALK
jgi:invasion protein IalB